MSRDRDTPPGDGDMPEDGEDILGDVPGGGDTPNHPHEHCGEAALYLLGLLDTRQRVAFLEHASACAVCRDEIDALRPAVDALPATVPQVAAPPHIKQSVMSVVREESHSRERPVPAGRHGASWGRAGTERSSRRLSWRLAAPALAFAAVVAAALAIALSAPSGGNTSRVVSAQVTMRGASAMLHRSGGQAWLTVSRMPEPSVGHVYEVWVKHAGHSRPQPTTGLFAPNSAGAGAVYVPGGLSGVSEVLVTQEPAGGSKVPTSPPVILARVS